MLRCLLLSASAFPMFPMLSVDLLLSEQGSAVRQAGVSSSLCYLLARAGLGRWLRIISGVTGRVDPNVIVIFIVAFHLFGIQ
jgi:hypothetical protein